MNGGDIVGKKHRSKGASQKARKRHYLKIKQRESRAKAYTENYYKQQANTINKLKPVMTAAKRFNDRAAEIEREIRNAVQTEKGGE